MTELGVEPVLRDRVDVRGEMDRKDARRRRSGRTRSLAAAAAPMHFNMLAVHWIGPGSVLYRTQRLHGGWRAWRTADADVAPDGGTGRWHDGNLDWTAASDAIQFRTQGLVSRLR